MSAIRRMVLVTVAASMALANLVPVFALSEGSAAFGSSLDASGCTGVPITSVANLQQSITSYGGGTTFCLAPGIYRIPTTLTLKTDQRLIGAGEPGTVVISGAKAVKATPTSGRWVISGQKTLGKSSFSGTSTQCRPINGKDPKGMCVYKDQVFLDDVSLWQVPSLKALSRGEFFWNYSTNKIYLADDPTGRRLEVSVVGGRALMGGVGVMIQNLVVEKFGNNIKGGAVIGAHANWTVTDSEIRLNHGGGVHMGPGTVLRRNYIHHNGQLGIHGGAGACAKAKGMIAEGNEIAYNNAAGYNWGFEGGATKWVNTDGLVVRGNYVHHNYGMGLWTDGANINVLYEDNRVEDNHGMGIDHELGQSAIIRNNEVRRNGFAHPQGSGWGAGIFIDQSRDVEVYGNVVEDNAAGITAVQEPAGALCGYPKSEVVNLHVHDNVVRQPADVATGLKLLKEPDNSYFSPTKNNRWENNQYVLGDPTRGLHFTWRGAVVDGKWTDRYMAVDWRGFGHDAAGVFRAGG